MAELHLPDLPEVPLHVGGVRPRRRASLGTRIRDALSSYLPLLLMGLLALGSWWLLKNAPAPPQAPKETGVRIEPDYTMTNFVLERFEPGGRLKARIQGAQMRHYPDTDRIEIDQLQFQAWSPDGRVTRASATRGLSNGDASEVQLSGLARVDSVDAQGRVTTMRSEFLHLFTVLERVQTHLPVQVNTGASEFRARAMNYDHGRGLLQAQGPLKATLPARVGAR
jgi:lipopolysaccharide export system protein LptC